jgi:predicted PurR-regulated permease PerM
MTKSSVAIGQNTMAFFINSILMLYLTFFLLRDGISILNWIRVALPLNDQREEQLFYKFSEVTRATLKGNFLVGVIQGSLGGLVFFMLDVRPAILWGVVLAIASLVPAVGTALVWGPVVIYFLIVGEFASAAILLAFGVFVIGLSDNLLRPIFVGRDTKLPDYIVLVSTLGGLVIFGIHGFVLGPLVAALFFVLWNMFVLEFNPNGAKRLALDRDIVAWESAQSKRKNYNK